MATNVQRSYDDVASRKESVLDMIELLTAQEDYFLSRLPKGTTISTIHSALTDDLRTAQSRAVAEGADATLVATTTPDRVTNITEIISVPFGVSGSQRAIEHYGHGDTLEYETTKALKDWSNAAEFDIVRSTLVSGVSGTAPKMNGMIASISTNATTQTSGTVFSETILNGMLELNWENSNGETATDIFVGAKMKRTISGFQGRAASQTITENDVVVNTVDMYLSDFGTHRVHLHRYVQTSSDATGRILGVNMEKWSLDYLREPVVQDLAKTGDSDKRQVIGELTLTAKNETCNFFADGFLKA